MKFKLGDRVTPTGFRKIGTVIDTQTSRGNVAAEMDKSSDGVSVHQFPGRKVLWLPEGAWEKIEQTGKILITSDGHTTTARLYDGKKVTKSAEAKCNPDDKFDFATGARLAFDRLMGTDNPKENKPAFEPIKLYCFEDCPCGCSKRGRVYEVKDGCVVGTAYHYGVGEFENHFVPLVSRPAKVGEWVYILPACSGTIYLHKGEIFRVNKTSQRQNGGVFVCIKENPEAPVFQSEYLVLDGYDGRYEEPEKPKGWNGKVVCVDDDGSRFVTTGKVYSFVDGWSKDNTGNKLFSAPMKSLDEINRRAGAKFIEFKGECHAE